MTENVDVLCAGIIVADHVCAPISHLPAAGELVMAERLLLTIGGCAANAAVDLSKMGVRASVVGRVGSDVFGRVVTDMLREQGAHQLCSFIGIWITLELIQLVNRRQQADHVEIDPAREGPIRDQSRELDAELGPAGGQETIDG